MAVSTQTALALQNYPNPFVSGTTIQFTTPSKQELMLHIYDIRGRLVKTLLDHEPTESGYHSVHWDGHNRDGTAVGSGVYLYRLETDDWVVTKKMTLLN